MSKHTIPYKINLSEEEMPRGWYNVRADMKTDHRPVLNPGTGQPVTAEDLGHVFCTELAKQELNTTDRFIPIPEEVLAYYRMYRPSPLMRAYRLEEALGTPAKIYYKYEGGNTSGSHKLNSAIAQIHYAKA
ncbi:MAG TPA: TrpB-like pyridoxal-phosphate dependent enzyme, partial [Oscillospiraceae bacterium]|nr:TrpB-like pyridoxal-phosphate dependent enzyme [Oscillospiraceae bacterium]